MATNFFKALDDTGKKRLFIHVPGMLMHGQRMILPLDGSPAGPDGLLGFLRQYGHVRTFVYDNKYLR